MCTLRKVDFGLTANAAMHGWGRKDDVGSETEARELGDKFLYSKELKVCFYKEK